MERSSKIISGRSRLDLSLMMAMLSGIGVSNEPQGRAMAQASQSLAPSVREPSMPPSRKPANLRSADDLAKLEAAQAKRDRKAARNVELVARGAFDNRRALLKTKAL